MRGTHPLYPWSIRGSKKATKVTPPLSIPSIAMLRLIGLSLLCRGGSFTYIVSFLEHVEWGSAHTEPLFNSAMEHIAASDQIPDPMMLVLFACRHQSIDRLAETLPLDATSARLLIAHTLHDNPLALTCVRYFRAHD